MSTNDISSDDGVSNNTSPTVYTRGDNTLWDDNELIRLWNEQLECENISRSAETENEKQKLEAAIRVALDHQELQEERGALNSHQENITSSHQFHELEHEQEEEEEEEEEFNESSLERLEETRTPEEYQQEKRKRRENDGQELTEDNNSAEMSSKAVKPYSTMRQEKKYERTNEQRERQKHRNRQSYSPEDMKSNNNNTFVVSQDGANATNERCTSFTGCERMPEMSQNYNSHLLSVSHLPDDVRVLVESFYNAGFSAGYYVARRETDVQRKSTRDNNNNNNIVSNNSNIDRTYYDSTKRKRF